MGLEIKPLARLLAPGKTITHAFMTRIAIAIAKKKNKRELCYQNFLDVQLHPSALKQKTSKPSTMPGT